MFRSPQRWLVVGAWFFALAFFTALASADDFRIDSRVFAGKEPKPVSENTTMFSGSIVYDFIPDKSVAIFDKPRGRFVLLDRQRKVKTEVTTAQLQSFCDRLQGVASAESNAFIRWVAEPHFDVKAGTKPHELVLSSPHMTYRVTTSKAESADAVEQYHEFSDWYARLNVMMNPGSSPPFPRLAVNQELADRGVLADQVQLTVQQGPLHRHPVELHSEHHVTWRLLESDRDKINETTNLLTTFKHVGLDEYRQQQGQTAKR